MLMLLALEKKRRTLINSLTLLTLLMARNRKSPSTIDHQLLRLYFFPLLRCHLVQARPGPMLSDILINSPIMVGEDGKPIGSGFDFSMDPMAADDPELAMVCYNETFLFNLSLYCQALRVSLEEQRQRQDEETRRVQQESLEQMQTGEGNLVIIEMILTLVYL